MISLSLSIPFALAAVLAATPDDLETAVSRMAKIGASSSPSFSPDGRRIALLSNLSGVPQVWIAPSTGGWPTMVTALEDPVGGVEWSPDGAWLAISVAPGGGMNQQVYLVRPDGTELRRLTEGGRETNWLGGWSADGAGLMFASNRSNPESMDAYLFDIGKDGPSLAAKNPGVGYLLDVSADGNFGILYRQKTRGDNDLFLVELQSGGETLLTPHDPPAQFGNASFSPDGRWVYLSTNGDRDRTAFARVKLSGGVGPIEILASREDAELQEAELGEDGGTAALLWNASGRSELSYYDLEAKEEIPGPKLPAEIVSGLTFSADGQRLAFTASGAASPPNVWVLERGKGLVQVTDSPHPGIDLDSLDEPELVRYPAHDGLPLTGWL
jgi:dipeptidyl aminopeptidase/acylaminoacyl peptidase